MKRYLVLMLVLAGCGPGDKMTKDNFEPDFSAGPPTMVYKTVKDYHDKVPVILSPDKTRIVSYPAPTDLVQDAKSNTDARYAMPVQLKNGYLLDNRGINENVAFISMTYAQYAQLKQAPSLDSLYAMIIDMNPLTELCNCGNRNAYKNPVRQLNQMIKKGTLKQNCHVIVGEK